MKPLRGSLPRLAAAHVGEQCMQRDLEARAQRLGRLGERVQRGRERTAVRQRDAPKGARWEQIEPVV